MLFATVPTGSLASSSVSIYGGDVTFSGQVVSSGCSVSSESSNMIVQMEQVRSNQFSGNGSWASSIPFHITLKDCDTQISQSAGVMFNGVTDTHDPQVFSTHNGADSAVGVGIGIFDSRGELVIPNTIPQLFSALQDGNTRLDFVAKYRATRRTVSGGSANTQVWFAVIYP
ncbi:fimbrial protein [Enterobacter ludwigii]|nr:fimbrial protein [Enterobacter ludwigii]